MAEVEEINRDFLRFHDDNAEGKTALHQPISPAAKLNQDREDAVWDWLSGLEPGYMVSAEALFSGITSRAGVGRIFQSLEEIEDTLRSMHKQNLVRLANFHGKK